MQIVTNFGSNVSYLAQGHYGISVVQDHKLASSSEWGPALAGLARTHDEIVAVVSSGKLGPSFAEAETAVAAHQQDPSRDGARTVVVDSRTTDIATALLTLVAAEAARAKAPLDLVLRTLEILARRSVFVWVGSSLHHPTRDPEEPRADTADYRPIFGLMGGEIKVVGHMPPRADRIDELAMYAAKVTKGAAKVWVGIGHSGASTEAMRLDETLARRQSVQYVYRRILAPTSIVHLGLGALALAILPLDGLPWSPSIPPEFSETRRPARRPRSMPG